MPSSSFLSSDTDSSPLLIIIAVSVVAVAIVIALVICFVTVCIWRNRRKKPWEESEQAIVQNGNAQKCESIKSEERFHE